MHGMELRSGERRAFRLSAPQPALSSPAGSMLPGTLQPFFLSPLGPDARNGLSLARNSTRFRGFHSGVNVPGLLLRFLHLSSRARSAFCSAADHGSPRSGGFVAEARFPFPVTLDPPAPGLRSLSGFLHPFSSKRSAGLLQISPPSESAR